MSLKYNRLSYAIALSLEAMRRIQAVARVALQQFERSEEMSAAGFVPANDGPDHEDGTDAEGFPGGDARMVSAPLDAIAAHELPRELSAECSGAGMSDAKPKRVRVRYKPLTPGDIVEGGEYVPKVGNNKTPNYFVWGFDGETVLYYRTNETCGVEADAKRASSADFLALVARRA